jgi:ATP-dependent RNA helicase SUPV3L1/SUV3
MPTTARSNSNGSRLIAVLGPTNTGKTHLAIERMCGHSSGLIGFPLRLLAREVYDRVVALKGAHQVALLTGEERITPPGARYVLATAEAMPLDGGLGAMDDFAFVALDEVQLAADPERGHIFTDRLLHARGREETMLLGSATMAPLIRHLLPEAEIIGRPRFSTLRYAGAAKLSRLPRRCAIVAFSAEEVYAVAELIRRQRGGAAVVMGALSPRTRNAQVAMFEAGEVDYLVATDAIGMGLNLSVDHVAFASLVKFDGRRRRRLTISEMAQIAGRAGRHQRDGSFGDVGTVGAVPAFTAEEVERIEEHRFPPLERIYWRAADLPMDDLDDLIVALEVRPVEPMLKAAPEAIDLAVLRRLADMPDVRHSARGAARISRLWAVCSVPDFQKLGADHHARDLHRLWGFLSQGDGHIPHAWFAGQLARLDTVQGDVDAIAGRIASVRTLAYIAQRADWLAEPIEMAARARALEERLSDALHSALRQRFVDARTSLLLRRGGLDNAHLPVDVEAGGTVTVDGQVIGRLAGFRFHVDPSARASEKRLLIGLAEKRLGKHLTDKAQALIDAEDKAFSLVAPPGGSAEINWDGVAIARLQAGAKLLAPNIALDEGFQNLPADMQQQVRTRLTNWMATQFQRHLPSLLTMEAGSRNEEVPAQARAVLARLADGGGVMPRATLDEALGQVSKDDRAHLRKAGVTIGALDLYHVSLIKPGAALWRMVLLSLRRESPLVELPPAGVVLLGGRAAMPGKSVKPSKIARKAGVETTPDEAPSGEAALSPVEDGPAQDVEAVLSSLPDEPADTASDMPVDPPPEVAPVSTDVGVADETPTLTPGFDPLGARLAGFRQLGQEWLRIDMAERLARAVHETLQQSQPFTAASALVVSLGLSEPGFLEFMRQAGFRALPEAPEGAANWVFRGRPKSRSRRPELPDREPNRAPAQPREPGQQRHAGRAGDLLRSGQKRNKADSEPGQSPRPAPRAPQPRSEPAPGQATAKSLAGLAALFGRDD